MVVAESLLNNTLSKIIEKLVIEIKVVYTSFTGQIKSFVERLEFDSVRIDGQEKTLMVDEPFVLITRSTGRGMLPDSVKLFLSRNSKNLKGVIGSGDTVWGADYCGGAKKVSIMYNVPLLHMFEKKGYDEDVRIVTEKIKEIERM